MALVVPLRLLLRRERVDVVVVVRPPSPSHERASANVATQPQVDDGGDVRGEHTATIIRRYRLHTIVQGLLQIIILRCELKTPGQPRVNIQRPFWTVE